MDLKSKNYSWEEVAGLNTGRHDMGATVHNDTLVRHNVVLPGLLNGKSDEPEGG